MELASPIGGDEGGPPSFDEAAEAAFLGSARERGESIKPFSAAGATDDEQEVSSGKDLPRMEELVTRIPADVRELLEELFRARFVTVKRIPKRALKS